jgi:hypothetical protein
MGRENRILGRWSVGQHICIHQLYPSGRNVPLAVVTQEYTSTSARVGLFEGQADFRVLWRSGAMRVEYISAGGTDA